jgi:hypothetical protein
MFRLPLGLKVRPRENVLFHLSIRQESIPRPAECGLEVDAGDMSQLARLLENMGASGCKSGHDKDLHSYEE